MIGYLQYISPMTFTKAFANNDTSKARPGLTVDISYTIKP